MCMECPEQTEGAQVATWMILNLIRKVVAEHQARGIENIPSLVLIEAIKQMPELTNDDANKYYEWINN